MRDARIEQLWQQVMRQANDLVRLGAAESQVRELDTKFHECFEAVEGDAFASVQSELSDRIAHVALHMTEFDGIKKEFQRIYDDMDEIDKEVRCDLTPAPGAGADANQALRDAMSTLQHNIDSNADQLDIIESAFEPSINRICVRMHQGEEASMQETSRLENREEEAATPWSFARGSQLA